jgi:glutamate racemase
MTEFEERGVGETLAAGGPVQTIGMFDSGVGGLSVLRKMEKLSGSSIFDRRLRFIYLGDTARCPYGPRDSEEIVLFVKQIVDWLISMGADRIVMACNTSAAQAGSVVRLRSPLPIHDLITPTAERLAGTAGRVAVLATNSTVKSGAFSKAIKRVAPHAEVTEIACPDLVPLVESGQADSVAARNALARYAHEYQLQNMNAVILGCTHYPFLSTHLADLLPAGVALIDPADELIAALARGSAQAETAGSQTPGEPTRYFVTGAVSPFVYASARCLGRELVGVQQLPLNELTGVAPVDLPSEAAIAADVAPHIVSPASL